MVTQSLQNHRTDRLVCLLGVSWKLGFGTGSVIGALGETALCGWYWGNYGGGVGIPTVKTWSPHPSSPGS